MTHRWRYSTLEISDELLCLFNAEVTVKDDEYVVEVPKSEIETGSVDPGDVYRVALIERHGDADNTSTTSSASSSSSTSTGASSEPQPPVEEGEIRYVEIEDIGKQGDGIARVERGYVIIVPDAEIGERVKVEVTEVKSNFAVGEIIDEEY
ncbi:TRAM domain-containing protein [Halobacterium salinarum]|uniref:Putative RNA-binding protein, contains TRAM domain n=1 Tax=Halobacterium salinarum (strain ATCC 33171 / DSM 3754 / JCM 8978 / NBRC 102687 / NCIMB 764 / 91-R6) TaxID=2597657 RepID=A0A663ACA9_HALS9|nr:putative RNA-binding protein, contains TRAM domain [Halobacterium salinarum DSM 3754]